MQCYPRSRLLLKFDYAVRHVVPRVSREIDESCRIPEDCLEGRAIWFDERVQTRLERQLVRKPKLPGQPLLMLLRRRSNYRRTSRLKNVVGLLGASDLIPVITLRDL